MNFDIDAGSKNENAGLFFSFAQANPQKLTRAQLLLEV
jgi:hypothetical protein